MITYPATERSSWLLFSATEETRMTSRRMRKHPRAKPTSRVVQSVFWDSKGGTFSRAIAFFRSPLSSSLVKRTSTCSQQCGEGRGGLRGVLFLPFESVNLFHQNCSDQIFSLYQRTICFHDYNQDSCQTSCLSFWSQSDCTSDNLEWLSNWGKTLTRPSSVL